MAALAPVARAARRRRFGQEACQLEALGLAARQGRHRLAQLHVFEPDVDDRLQHAQHLGVAGEEGRRLADGQVQHLGHVEQTAAALDAHLQDLGAITPAVAIGAAQVDVAEELHLDVLEAGAAAGRAAPLAGVEAEHAGAVAALQRQRRLREQLADLVEGAHVAGRVRAGGLADRRLVDEHHVADLVGAGQAPERARRLGGLAHVARHGRIEHVLQQGRLARARHAGQADQPLQRDLDRDVAQVVLAGAFQHQPRRARLHRAARPLRGMRHLAAAAQVGAGQRVGRADLAGRAVVDDAAAALAGAGAHVDQAIGGQHHRGIVLDHHQRVAGVAQPLHGLDDAVQVARMQADAGLVEHEQGLGQRGAQRGGQVDALHLAARQGAALAVQRQVAEADVAEVFQARAHLGQQQLERIVEQRAGQTDAVEETADPLDRQQHQVVHGQARQRLQLGAVPVDAARHEARGRRQHRVGVGLRAEPPQQRFGLQARAAADFAGRVTAVLREQHADVHLVGLRLQIAEEALHAVPLGLPLAVPVGRSVDHPVALGIRELAPGRAATDPGALGIAHQVVLALLPGRRLHRLDRALAQRLARVGNHQAQVDADHAAETAAGLAGAIGRVEREQRRLRLGIAQVAVGMMQAGGEAPDLRLGRGLVGVLRRRRQHVDVDAAGAAPERCLDRLDHARLLRVLQAEAVGHHVEHLARARLGHHLALRLHARVAARRQPLLDLLGRHRLGQLDREGHYQARVLAGRARGQLGVDRLGRVMPHRLRGLAVEQLGRARVEQLQVVVQLGHGADRGARAAHRVGLVDRDRGRHAVHAVHLGAVHAVQELPRIGAEGLDVAALALGIERVEHQARLARPRRTGHDRHLAGAQVEIDILEIVLACSANADQMAG